MAAPGCNAILTPRRHSAARPHCAALLEAAKKHVAENENIKTVALAAAWRGLTIQEISDLIQWARDLDKDVILIGQRIVWSERVPLMASSSSSISHAQNKAQQLIMDGTSKRTETQREHFEGRVPYVDFVRLQCGGGFCPIFTDDNEVIYVDRLHLSRAGIEWIAERLKTEYPNLLN